MAWCGDASRWPGVEVKHGGLIWGVKYGGLE